MVSSRNCPWLKDGVTMLIHGQGWPSGITSGKPGLSFVQGQPVRPGGGTGKSATLGQRTVTVRQTTASEVASSKAAYQLPDCLFHPLHRHVQDAMRLLRSASLVTGIKRGCWLDHNAWNLPRTKSRR